VNRLESPFSVLLLDALRPDLSAGLDDALDSTWLALLASAVDVTMFLESTGIQLPTALVPALSGGLEDGALSARVAFHREIATFYFLGAGEVDSLGDLEALIEAFHVSWIEFGNELAFPISDRFSLFEVFRSSLSSRPALTEQSDSLNWANTLLDLADQIIEISIAIESQRIAMAANLGLLEQYLFSDPVIGEREAESIDRVISDALELALAA
jgi:hypothetical protein